MCRNVMSPIIARRLGACVNITTTVHNARISTTAIRRQKLPSDHHNEHLDRLALLQAEDLEKLKPVKAKIKDYDAVLNKGVEFLATLPVTLAPLAKLNTAHTSVERAIALAEAQTTLSKLKDATLPNLLAHVEDLELEEFPEPGSDETEIEFLQRARSMSDEERKDLLDSLNMEFGAAIAQATESVQSVQWRGEERSGSGSGSDTEPEATIERKENPFAKVAAKTTAAVGAGKKKTEEKAKFGMSTDDQFANVIADAVPRKDATKKKKVADTSFGLGQNTGEVTTWRPVVSEKPKTPEPRDFPRRADDKAPKPRGFPRRADDDAPKPKSPMRDLNSLQAQLEASFRKSANR
jgi:hypothetical protein